MPIPTTPSLGLKKPRLTDTADIQDINDNSDLIDEFNSDYVSHKAEEATTSARGHMSASDKTKLNGIEAGAEVNPDVATQAEAEEGTNNTKIMTPLRVKQAIDFYSDTVTYYDRGDEATTLTGGWSEVTGGDGAFTGTATKNVDNLYCLSPSAANNCAAFATINKIDLTNVIGLEITWNGQMTSTGFVAMTVASTRTDRSGGVAQWLLRQTGTFAERTDTLDVSGITGNYYIQLLVQTGATGQTAEAYFRVVMGVK